MGDDTTLRDDDVAKELVQPDTESVAEGEDGSLTRTLRRSGWRAASDGGRYAASCCRALRCPPTLRSQQPSTRGQPRGRLERESDRKTRVE